MKLAEALVHAARFSVAPTFTLFHVSATGQYDLICQEAVPCTFGSNADEQQAAANQIAERFKLESLKPETVGLEVRCNGIRVDFDGV